LYVLVRFSGCRWIEAWRAVFDTAEIVNRPSVAVDEAEQDKKRQRIYELITDHGPILR
jgi:hypothetical protein